MIELIKNFLSQKLIQTETFSITVGSIVLVVLVMIVTGIVLKLIRVLATRKLPIEDKNKFISFFQFVRYVVFTFVFIITLHMSGVNMSVFLTASAALLVGLGFALQQLFQDIISGILMVLDQSLHVGDIVEVDGRVGTVLEIKLRTTRVVTRNNRVMIIPNHKFMLETLLNWTQNDFTNREQVNVGVAYGSDVIKVREILENCANATVGVLKNPKPNVLFEDFADSSLNFAIYFFVENGMKSPGIQSEMRFRIDKAFKENGIQIPFPQRDIHIINKNNE
jgi:small-conductance mechanosensitive channel